MKTVRQILAEGKTVSYAAHDDFGSPAQKVLARRSGSSAGGDMEEEVEQTDKPPRQSRQRKNYVNPQNVYTKTRESLQKAGRNDEFSHAHALKVMQGLFPKHTASIEDGRVKLKEEKLEEGNPLATMHKHQEEGRHFIALSTERPGLSKKEVKIRNAALVASARAEGFGVRKAEGRYEGGKETSHIIHAKAPGREAGAELVAFGRKMGQKFDQDSVLHHNGKTARLIGTNETGFPGKGNSEKVGGKLKYNNPESPFQTELRPSKKKAPARFTT